MRIRKRMGLALLILLVFLLSIQPVSARGDVETTGEVVLTIVGRWSTPKKLAWTRPKCAFLSVAPSKP